MYQSSVGSSHAVLPPTEHIHWQTHSEKHFSWYWGKFNICAISGGTFFRKI